MQNDRPRSLVLRDQHAKQGGQVLRALPPHAVKALHAPADLQAEASLFLGCVALLQAQLGTCRQCRQESRQTSMHWWCRAPFWERMASV